MTAAYADGTSPPRSAPTPARPCSSSTTSASPHSTVNEANAFFQVVNRRYENSSATIVTTNSGLTSWAELFGGDNVVAAAIFDRLLDNATVINIRGPSWRLREHQALTQPITDLVHPTDKPPRTSRR